MRTFAIGDIHGCAYALQTLLESLQITSEDRLIFLGDYIDRGPMSKEVLEILIELSENENHVFLRGNHDEWMLRARFDTGWLRDWLRVGGDATLASYDAVSLGEIPESHFQFLESTRFFFQTPTEIFAHAAVSQRPPHENNSEWLLWGRFSSIAPHPSGKRIIVGHSAQKSGLPKNVGFAVCVDTACYAGGWLTALEIETNRVFQASEAGQKWNFDLWETPAL